MKQSLVWSAVFVFIFLLGWPVITSAEVRTLQGWGWSSNIGWVKFANDGNNWNVVIDKDSGYFQGRDGGPGYAWSNNIGWVKFHESLDGPGPNPREGLRLTPPGGGEGSIARGWARACSVAVDCNFNNLKPPSESGGWDGWICFGCDYGGGGGGGDGFWWWHDRHHDWWWGVFECNDEIENDDPSDNAIDEADPECHTDGDPNNPDSYIFYWTEAVRSTGNRNNSNWFGWLGNLVERAWAQGGDGHERIVGFGWGADVLGWLFVDLEVDGDPEVTLTVTKSGNGTGTVTSSDGGIDCGIDYGSDCFESYDLEDPPKIVQLTQIPSSNSTFEGWSVDCPDGEVTMDSNKTCNAIFELDEPEQFTLYVNVTTGSGTGDVTSQPSGIDCGLDCSHNYNENTEVTLDPTADGGSSFTGWSGDDDCSNGEVTMNANKTCNAIFELDEPPGNDPCQDNGLRIMGDGVIEITSQPLDHQVFSSFERIENTCSATINVSVKDILSVVYDRGQGGNGSLIDEGTLMHPPENDQLNGDGNQKLPQCLLRLGNEELRDCRSWDGSNFPIGPGQTATFGIQIWRPIRTIKDNQPYQVRLGDRCIGGGQECNPNADGRNVRLRFEYRVGNVIDE